MVNDIEKMKAEFAKKLEQAELENKLSEGLKGFSISVGGTNVPGCSHSLWMRMPYISGQGFADPTLAMGKEMLERFPMTQDTLYDRKFNLPYVVHSRKSYGDRFAELTVGWISNEYNVRVTLMARDFLCGDFFNIRKRCPVDTEVSTYVAITQNGLVGRDVIDVYDFKKKQQAYYGGVRLLLDKDEIMRVVEFIKTNG